MAKLSATEFMIYTNRAGGIIGVFGLPPGMSCLVHDAWGNIRECPHVSNPTQALADDDEDEDEDSEFEDPDDDDDDDDDDDNDWEEVGDTDEDEIDSEDDEEDDEEWCDDDDDDNDELEEDGDFDEDSEIFDRLFNCMQLD